MRIRTVKQLDLNNINLIRYLVSCPEGCNVSHCDVEDDVFDAHLKAYHNDPWEGENIEHLLTLDEDDDLLNYEDYEEEYNPLHYL